MNIYSKYTPDTHTHTHTHTHVYIQIYIWAHTEDVLLKAFNVRVLDEVFAEIEKTPLGSGSIAQVYKARFRGEDTFVAIKVCHT